MVVVVALYAGLVAAGMSLALLWGLKYAALFLALTCYLSFSWASRRFFRRVEPLNSCQRRVLASMYVTAILQGAAIIYKNHGTIWHFVGALFLYQASLLLFWSSVLAARRHALALFFSGEDHPTGLLTSGPYHWVRHPFYTAYTLSWVAGVVATNQLWLLASVAVCLLIYHRAATLEEQRFYRSGLAEEYLAYSHRAGMFWPLPSAFLPEAPEPIVSLPTSPEPAPALERTERAWLSAPSTIRAARHVRSTPAAVAVAANFSE